MSDKYTTVTIIQNYAPTSEVSEEVKVDFYSKLHDAVIKERGTYIIVMGDFNAIVDAVTVGENFVGEYSIGERNKRGRLVEFAEENNLKITSTLFKKRKAPHLSGHGWHSVIRQR